MGFVGSQSRRALGNDITEAQFFIVLNENATRIWILSPNAS